jgi:hypothetical protein
VPLEQIAHRIPAGDTGNEPNDEIDSVGHDNPVFNGETKPK